MTQKLVTDIRLFKFNWQYCQKQNSLFKNMKLVTSSSGGIMAPTVKS